MKRMSMENLPGRRCAVCGQMGGSGMTMAITALREAGAHLTVPEETRYAHNDYVHKARQKLEAKKK